MKNPLPSVLIAEDDPLACRVLSDSLSKQGLQVLSCSTGSEAWKILHRPKHPRMAILDWMLPDIEGIEICRRVREHELETPPYIIMLTARNQKDDIITGLRAGANDYVIKPFDEEELYARVQVGQRIIALQDALAQRVKDLEASLAREKQLQGLLPICSYCNKIRDDGNYWRSVEQYISEHSDATFSHGVCPDCYEKFLVPQLRSLDEDKSS